jgi:hypothetical protein
MGRDTLSKSAVHDFSYLSADEIERLQGEPREKHILALQASIAALREELQELEQRRQAARQ